MAKFKSTQWPVHYHEHHEVERNQVDPQYAQYSPLIKKDAAKVHIQKFFSKWDVYSSAHFPYYEKWEKKTIRFIILTLDLSQTGKKHAKPPESTKLDYQQPKEAWRNTSSLFSAFGPISTTLKAFSIELTETPTSNGSLSNIENPWSDKLIRRCRSKTKANYGMGSWS